MVTLEYQRYCYCSLEKMPWNANIYFKNYAILFKVSKVRKSIFGRKAPDKSKVLLLIGYFRSHSTDHSTALGQARRLGLSKPPTDLQAQ